MNGDSKVYRLCRNSGFEWVFLRDVKINEETFYTNEAEAREALIARHTKAAERYEADANRERRAAEEARTAKPSR